MRGIADESEFGKHLGLPLFVDATPVIWASQPSSDGGPPGDRQGFATAHELAQVTLHWSCPQPETLAALGWLKNRWGVAIKAMVGQIGHPTPRTAALQMAATAAALGDLRGFTPSHDPSPLDHGQHRRSLH